MYIILYKMSTIVSGFISNCNSYRTIEKYINYGKKLIDIPINKIIFIEQEIYDENLANYVTDKILEYTKFIFIKKKDMYLYEYYDQITDFSPISTNPTKDTIEYMFIQCYKTEFMRMAIKSKLYDSNQFVWLDFGIYHIFNDNEELFNKLILNLNTNTNMIRIASGNHYPLSDIYKNICWFFLGGIFGGNKNMLLIFADLMKLNCINIITKKNTITWEINIWYLIYQKYPKLFSIYNANHDSTMIENY